MKYCAQCGERLEDGDMYCPNCGARQEETEETAAQAEAGAYGAGYAADTAYDNYGAAEQQAEAAPVKKKKKKTGLIVTLAVIAALLAAAALLYVTGAYASLLPHGKLKLGVAENRTIEDLLDSEVFEYEFADKVDFTLSFNIDSGNLIDSSAKSVVDVLNQLGISGTVDSSDGLALALKADYKGNTAVDIRLMADDENLGLYFSPASDDYYTMSYKALCEKLFPDADTSKLPKLFEKLDMKLVREDVRAIYDIIIDTLKTADIKVENNVTVELFKDKEQHTAAVYTVMLSEDQVKELLNIIADYIESDECYVKDYFENSALLLNIVSEGEALEGLGDTSLSGMMAEFRERIPELASSYVEEGFVFEVVMEGNEIIRQRLYNEDGSVAYDRVKEGNTTKYAIYSGENGDDDFYIEVTEVENGKKKQTSAQFCFDGEKVAVLEADVNTASRSVIGTYEGEYKLTVFSGEGADDILMHVSPVEGGMLHNIKWQSGSETLSVIGLDSLNLNLVVSEGSRVTLPAGVKTVDISDYSEMKLYFLLSSLASNLSNQLSGLFG